MDLSKGTEIFEEVAKYLTLPKLIICGVAIAITAALLVALNITFNHLKKRFAKEFDSKKLSILNIVVNILRIVIAIAAVIIILQIIGVNVTSMVAGLGLFGAIIGLAFQDSLKDIFMGMIIMFDGYFTVGDPVEYNGLQGIVVSFNLRTTKIKSLDDNSIRSISNRNISEISKLSDMVDIDIGLSYEEDVKKIYETLTEVCARAKELEHVEDCVFKGTQGFDSSAVIYKVRFFCKPVFRPDTRRAVIREIQKGLDEAGINIPYNQLVIHDGKSVQAGERAPY